MNNPIISLSWYVYESYLYITSVLVEKQLIKLVTIVLVESGAVTVLDVSLTGYTMYVAYYHLLLWSGLWCSLKAHQALNLET